MQNAERLHSGGLNTQDHAQESVIRTDIQSSRGFKDRIHSRNTDSLTRRQLSLQSQCKQERSLSIYTHPRLFGNAITILSMAELSNHMAIQSSSSRDSVHVWFSSGFLLFQGSAGY